MKTLYVSDLDGTLFNRKKKLSEDTISILNKCMENGMHFTVATARMPYGCDYRLEKLSINTPGILTNGVFLYDFATKKYINVVNIEKESAKKAVSAIEKVGLSCFVYLFSNDEISIYYKEKELEQQTQYYSERALSNCKEVKCVDDFESIWDEGKVVYLALTGTEEEMSPLQEALDLVPGIHYSYYLNIYNGLYCMEIFGQDASKKNALKLLKELGNYDELVVFGDNLNDLSMIEIADRSYAPANALDVVKERVNEVLDDCDRDGVAKFLGDQFGVRL